MMRKKCSWKIWDLRNPGLDKLVRASYSLLGLMSFLTSGEDETRDGRSRLAQKLLRQPERSIQILRRGFIKAEVVNYKDLLDCGSYAGAREKGLVLHGKEKNTLFRMEM